MISIFQAEDDHWCDKHWCQFYNHTNKHKSKTPLIWFSEFLNLDSNIALMQPIVWVKRVLYSSGGASRYSDGPLDSMYSVTTYILPFDKHQHRLLKRIVLLERTEGLLVCKLAGYTSFALFIWFILMIAYQLFIYLKKKKKLIACFLLLLSRESKQSGNYLLFIFVFL